MLRAEWTPYVLDFLFLARTSRSDMRQKSTYFIKIYDDETPERYGIGEAALFRGLSADDTPDYEHLLNGYCHDIDSLKIEEIAQSSIRFGMEIAFADLQSGGLRQPFMTDAFKPISINGLVWMGDKATMIKRLKAKIEAGFRCIKLKIGGINFDDEIDIISSIRSAFSASELEIRLDANGAFNSENALIRLSRLSAYSIHSLEQPIAKGNILEMAKICKESPIPIALDEELIGMTNDCAKADLLTTIKPAYIILKPSLCGGFAEADKWIDIATQHDIGWWATSALESDIGLNAIARWLSLKNFNMRQGLGTGQLYANNIPSPLTLQQDKLCFDINKQWDLSAIKFAQR
jgi:o-succinylbenzoate synthase